MPILRARVDEDLKSLFLQKAEERNLSESELLRKVVLDFFAHEKNKDEVGDVLRTVEPDAENAENEKMTIRLPRFLVDAAKDKAKAKGMVTSRWIAALVQSSLMQKPVMADQELTVLRSNIRELNAIGRNINQMARALNESKNNTDKVKLDTLDLLRNYLDRNIAFVRGLVRASQQAWGLESNVTD
jgi:predicted DNA binding CopG/RHH family protein